jgi:hypothetical protein
MKHIKLLTAIFIFLSGIGSCFAQIKKEKADFRGFPEGVYKNAGQFLERKPYLEKPEMLIRGNATPSSIISWVKSDSLYHKNESGIRITMSIDSIWAIYEAGTLYIQLHGLVHKVNTFGMLCMFYESFPLVQAPFNPVASDQTRKLSPKMLDMVSGNVLSYNIETMKIFLKKNDDLLYQQFMALRRNKMRKKQLFHFIELYNEYHPIL